MKKIIFLTLTFILIAVPAFAASVSLTWTAPTTNEDGSPLTDLAGYRLYWGNSSGTYVSTVDVGNVTVFVLDLGNVESETVYINATAYDLSGNESVYNGEISLPFGANPPAPPTDLNGTVSQ